MIDDDPRRTWVDGEWQPGHRESGRIISDSEGTNDPSPTPRIEDYGDAGVRVFLPHQCDDWDIAGYESKPVEPAVAEARLEDLLAAIENALDALEPFSAGR